MKILQIISLLFLFSACQETEEVEKPIIDDDKLSDKELSLEEYAKRHIEAQLKIPASEKYDLSIYRANLDGDDKEDAIITVNRLDFAINEAASSPNPAKRAELGFMGNFNHFFFYDGGLKLISPTFTIPSSPLLPLKVHFINLSSSDYQDVIIEFRIRNAAYNDYYSVSNHTPKRVFQWKKFDGLGTSKSEAFAFEYPQGTATAWRDITVKEGKISNLPDSANWNTFDPEVRAEKKELFRFFYLPKEMKYVTKK
jgi:hypothetical protein